MLRALLRGVVTDVVVVAAIVEEPLTVFDGGPRSLGDELIVRTSRFFATPKNKKHKNLLKSFLSFKKENLLIEILLKIYLKTWEFIG